MIRFAGEVLYFRKTSSTGEARWHCRSGHPPIAREQMEALLADPHALRAWACQGLGFCSGDLVVRVLEVTATWDSTRDSTVGESFFRYRPMKLLPYLYRIGHKSVTVVAYDYGHKRQGIRGAFNCMA